jgi:hypothetical protein
MTIYTPEQYILHSVLKYPTLFSGYDYNDTKFRVLDQLLNVNGNGIRDNKELLEELKYCKFDELEALKYTKGESIYYGYYEIDDRFKFTEVGKGDPIYVLESERDNYPNIKLWNKSTIHTHNPYPNFEKDCSIVWSSDFKSLGQEWREIAIWFYTKCHEYFYDQYQCYSYDYSFPYFDTYQNRDLTHHRLEDFQKHIKDKYESYEALSKAYGVEGYNGDDYDFLVRRWQKEKTRIIAYINETIKYLEE